jgi:hypothetical protein
MTSLDLVHKAVQERADDILRPYFTAMKEGDWRASEALLDRVYGKATSKTETTTRVGLPELLALSPAELQGLRAMAIETLARQAALDASTEVSKDGARTLALPSPTPPYPETND